MAHCGIWNWHNRSTEMIRSVKSQLSIVHYMGLCVFSLPIFLMMTEKVYTWSYCHHHIRSMNDFPLFRVRSWNNGMSWMSLYILIKSSDTKPNQWSQCVFVYSINMHMGAKLLWYTQSTQPIQVRKWKLVHRVWELNHHRTPETKFMLHA